MQTRMFSVTEIITMKRDYRLHELPLDAKGNVRFRDSSDASYKCYLEWLAHYLSTTDLPSDVVDQPDLLRFYTGDIRGLAGALGVDAAWRENDEMQAWVEQQERAGERETESGDGPESLSGGERAELLAEAEEETRIFGDYRECYADLGWRLPLAILMRRVDTKSERLVILQDFFRSYREESRK